MRPTRKPNKDDRRFVIKLFIEEGEKAKTIISRLEKRGLTHDQATDLMDQIRGNKEEIAKKHFKGLSYSGIGLILLGFILYLGTEGDSTLGVVAIGSGIVIQGIRGYLRSKRPNNK